MIEYYSILMATCSKNFDHNCWDQDMIKIEEGESKEEAIQFLEDLGWEIHNDQATCPYCSSGITRDELSLTPEKLKLVKGDD